jgi:protoheme ferro-lyase
MRVMCPAFVSDCLETIEEIGMRGRETFLEAGGQDFKLIPCLNEHPAWLHALHNMVTARWPEVTLSPGAAGAREMRPNLVGSV